jgi:hypothetical protein
MISLRFRTITTTLLFTSLYHITFHMLSQEDVILHINRICQPDGLIAHTTADGFVYMTQYTQTGGFQLNTFLNLVDAKGLIKGLINAFPHINSINDLHQKASVLDPKQGVSLYYPLALACIFWFNYGALELRKWISETFARYLGGDLTLIEEVTRNRDLSMGSETVYQHKFAREASRGEKRKYMVHHVAAAHSQALTAVLAPDVAASSTVTSDNGVIFAQMFASFDTTMQEHRDQMQQELRKKQEQHEAREKKQRKQRKKQEKHRMKLQQEERRQAGDRLQEQLDQTGAFNQQLQVTMDSYKTVSDEFVKLTREAAVLRRQNSDLLLEKDDLVVDRDEIDLREQRKHVLHNEGSEHERHSIHYGAQNEGNKSPKTSAKEL